MVDRDPIETWTDDCVTLIGDAAHATYPVGSSGGSQAVIDARKLGRAFLDQGVNVGALDQYEAEVLPVANKVIETNRGSGPDAILQLVEDRCGGQFDDINDVIPQAELEAHAQIQTYRRVCDRSAQLGAAHYRPDERGDSRPSGKSANLSARVSSLSMSSINVPDTRLQRLDLSSSVGMFDTVDVDHRPWLPLVSEQALPEVWIVRHIVGKPLTHHDAPEGSVSCVLNSVRFAICSITKKVTLTDLKPFISNTSGGRSFKDIHSFIFELVDVTLRRQCSGRNLNNMKSKAGEPVRSPNDLLVRCAL